MKKRKIAELYPDPKKLEALIKKREGQGWWKKDLDLVMYAVLVLNSWLHNSV